jgi:FAD/FMN-containing dehydrogenase
MTRNEIESLLSEIVGRDLRMDARYPLAAPRTVEAAVQLVRTARDHQFSLMILGDGSSFPADFTMLRENVVVIRTGWLNTVQRITPFAVRASCGAAPSTLIQAGTETTHRTIGGLICDPRGGLKDPVLRAFWARVRRIEVITATGEIKQFAGPAAASLEDPATANLFIGTRGRMGMITSVELGSPIPVTAADRTDGSRGGAAGVGDSPLSQKEIQTLADPTGVFQWS